MPKQLIICKCSNCLKEHWLDEGQSTECECGWIVRPKTDKQIQQEKAERTRQAKANLKKFNR